jgi:dienelactone hydrolase
MSESSSTEGKKVWIDPIPALVVEPTTPRRQLAIFLPGLTGTKEAVLPYLRDLADAGFLAVGFDPWQHGERGSESREQIVARVFSGFRRQMWPILGQTTLDTLRVIDWAIDTYRLTPHVVMGGISMGGDISVAAAGIDRRIERVGALIATPDWARPGMQDSSQPGKVIDQGKADAYAQYFYDHLNPLTHLGAYAHGPHIRFVCGAVDAHVPPDGALRFHAELRANYPAAYDRVLVELVPGRNHNDFHDSASWWPDLLEWMGR